MLLNSTVTMSCAPRVAAGLLSAALLVGCVNADGTSGGEGSPMWWRSASEQQRADLVNRRCAGYGFAEGTPERAQCAANEYRIYAANTEAAFARSQASLANLQGQLANTQAAMSGL